MLEEMLIQLLVLSLFVNATLAIITIILLIAITIIIYNKNHISARQ